VPPYTPCRLQITVLRCVYEQLYDEHTFHGIPFRWFTFFVLPFILPVPLPSTDSLVPTLPRCLPFTVTWNTDSTSCVPTVTYGFPFATTVSATHTPTTVSICSHRHHTCTAWVGLRNFTLVHTHIHVTDLGGSSHYQCPCGGFYSHDLYGGAIRWVVGTPHCGRYYDLPF